MIKIQDLLLFVLCIELGFGFAGTLIKYVEENNVVVSNFTYNNLDVTNLSVDVTPLVNNSLDLMHKMRNDENTFTVLNVFGLFSDFLSNILPILFMFGFFITNTFSLASLIGSEATFFLASTITVLFDIIILFNILFFIMGKSEI